MTVRRRIAARCRAFSTIELDPTTAETKKLFTGAARNINQWAAIVDPHIDTARDKDKFDALVAAWKAYDDQSRQLIEYAGQNQLEVLSVPPGFVTTIAVSL